MGAFSARPLTEQAWQEKTQSQRSSPVSKTIETACSGTGIPHAEVEIRNHIQLKDILCTQNYTPITKTHRSMITLTLKHDKIYIKWLTCKAVR